jgi:outer membrane immunogenic protein
MKKLLFAVALGAVATTPALAQDADSVADTRSGLRLEGRVMWERLNDPQESVGINYELGSGLSFGGEIGYDIAVSSNVVVGPYALYEASTVEECDVNNFCVSSGGYWAAGVHVGIVTGPKGMVYIKGGYGQQTIDAVGPIEGATPGTFINVDDSETGGGYNFAGGYEHSFSKNFYGRIELGISESYDIYTLDFQRANVGVALGARF